MALADSSDLGTNPATGASWMRSAKSASACVEIKMMTGPPELAPASRRANDEQYVTERKKKKKKKKKKKISPWRQILLQ